MSERMVMCRKLNKELPGLRRPPFRNALGQRLYEEVSQEAWNTWLQESVRIINTHGLDLADPRAGEEMYRQVAIYFGFEEGELAPTAWTPQKDPTSP